jgi:hypothetical protein
MLGRTYTLFYPDPKYKTRAEVTKVLSYNAGVLITTVKSFVVQPLDGDDSN